jgi:hypothetical protein
MLRLLVAANVVPISQVLVTIKAIRSAETTLLTKATGRHLPEDGMFHGNTSWSTVNSENIAERSSTIGFSSLIAH